MQHCPHQIDETKTMTTVFIPLHVPSSKPSGWPILALGFRPFYLLAAIWMVFALPLWLAIYAHGLQSASHLQAGDWHMHEMLFGFTGAIIVGFLFTAVRSWTNVASPIDRLLPVLGGHLRTVDGAGLYNVFNRVRAVVMPGTR